MKALGPVVLVKKMFESYILKTYLFTMWPTYAIKQNHWSILVDDHPGTIPFEFGQNTISGSR